MRNDKRCFHCGRSKFNAEQIGSTHCNPPFQVQPHLFNGQHPADLIEANGEEVLWPHSKAAGVPLDHIADAFRYKVDADGFHIRLRSRFDRISEWFADIRPGCAYAICFVLGGFATIVSLIVLGALI